MTLSIQAYEGRTVTFRDDGWFNATQAASHYDKEPFDWLIQRETVAYIAALAKQSGNSGFLQEFNEIKHLDGTSPKSKRLLHELVKKSGFVKSKAGAPTNGGGTWLHPKLAVPMARWLDLDFAVWCDGQIDDIIRNGKTKPEDAEYLPTYHALHGRINVLAAASKNADKVHMNINKLINKTIGVESGQRHSLPLPRKSLMVVAQAAATYAMDNANDHHDGYQMAKGAMQLLKPVADQLAGQPSLKLG